MLEAGALPVLVLIFASVLTAAPAPAEIAVLVTGDVLKIEAFELRDRDRMRLVLRGGGALTLPLGRIERIVDDEVVEIEEPVAGYAFELGWREDAAVPDSPYGDLIYETAERHGLNPVLLAAMTRAESAYDASAVSVKGARGLMQLMPATASRFGVGPDELFEPRRNLDAGARYVVWLIDRFEGELVHVLAAYNAGEGAVERHGGVPPYRETRGYVAKILGLLGVDPEPRTTVSSSG